MPSSRSTIVWEHDEITPNLRALPGKLGRGIEATMAYHAPRVQNYARETAPWTDRTSNARNGLFATPFKSGGTAGGRDVMGRFTRGSSGSQGIVLYHSVDYGIWLEVRFSGQYAVISPTIEAMGPQVMRTLTRLLARI